ncbi:MAG: MBL fold metallo-hydrolase [Pseudohongiellaceae bacterium]
MKISFLGGSGTVTGSKYLVESGSTRLLVDCGLFQGYKGLRERNWGKPPFDTAGLDAVVLTHAHLDHSGYLPVLYRHGYRRPVYTHRASSELCAILLPDSGHIQEEDARYYARHGISRHASPQPLYTQKEAEDCLANFVPLGFEEAVDVGDIRLHLQSAGHILGAGSVVLKAEGKTVIFSGDVGRPDDIFMQAPKLLPPMDLLVLESTYGNRLHEDTDPSEQLAGVVNETVRKGGVILIPSFAVGRAQTLMFIISRLIAEGRIPALPVYLDSPMAIDVSGIYCRYADLHRLDADQCHAMCDVVTYTRTVEESKMLAGQNFPHIIIAGSGMATGGRILHHMKRLLGDYKTTVLFTGYQAGGTRGAKMLQGSGAVKIHGQWIPNRARTIVLDGLSGHGDYKNMGDWLVRSKLPEDTSIQLVHGDPDALEGMRDHLGRLEFRQVAIAEHNQILVI